jgi:hypothetical protein
MSRFLTGVRQTVLVGLAHRKVRKLWVEFKTQLAKTEYEVPLFPWLLLGADWRGFGVAVDNSEFAVHARKLNDFLDNFQSMYTQFVAGSNETQRAAIDKIYGDCTEVCGSRRGGKEEGTAT